jgi:hypothetical protein
MATALKKRVVTPLHEMATAFVQTIFFDHFFNYMGGRVDQVTIFPDAPANWESESCRLTPYFWYEYTRVTKTNPHLGRSGQTQINRALKKLRIYTSLAKTKDAVLRILKEPIKIKFHPEYETIAEVHYLEESLSDLTIDTLAMERETREMPDRLKKISKELSKKSVPKPKKRRPKQK